MTFSVPIPIALAVRLNKIDKNKLTKRVGYIKPHLMANEPALDKVMMTFQAEIELRTKLDKEAAARKMTRSELIIFVLQRETSDTELTPEDYEEIAKQIRKNKEAREKKRVG